MCLPKSTRLMSTPAVDADDSFTEDDTSDAPACAGITVCLLHTCVRSFSMGSL